MITSHRADIAIFQESAASNLEGAYRLRPRVRENLVKFIWHDINEEDLLEDDNLLNLLDSRSHHKPDEFMHFDADMLRFLASTGYPPYRVFAEPDGTIERSWIHTGCFSGIVEPGSAESLPDGCATFSGEYFDVLSRQLTILLFLVSVRKFTLEESSNIDQGDAVPLSLAQNKQMETACINDWRWSLRHPYRPPKVDNLDICSKLVQTRLEEARDRLHGIRECPRTFQDYTKKFESHDPEWVLDKDGKPWLGPVSRSTRNQFRDHSVTKAVVYTFREAWVWSTLSYRLASVQGHTPRSTEWNDAVRSLKVYLNGVVRSHLLTNLRFYFMTSPAFKGYMFRTTKRRAGKIEHDIDFKHDLIADLTHDKLGWIFAQLVKSGEGAWRGLDDITLIIELRRLLENGTVSSVHICSSLYKVIADLALYAELWIQCRAYAPAIFYHMSVADHEVESTDTKRAIEDWHQIGRELMKLFDRENDETFFRLGHTVHHSLDTLQYPVDKPRNKSRNMTMQNSELALDNFWDEFDKHVKKHCSQHCFDVWESLWPQKEDLRRTEDWKDAETAPLVGRLAAVNLDFGHEEKAPATEVARPPKKKSKKKKRKAQVPESENIQDARPNEAEDDTTQPEKPRISVSKRAWEVFHDGLWFVPKEKKKPAELRWQDFLHAMTSLGFNATKMFGSVWRFEAGERAQSAGLERSINFHEPHGNTTKLGPWKARRYGRRLTRVYGIDMSSLSAGK